MNRRLPPRARRRGTRLLVLLVGVFGGRAARAEEAPAAAPLVLDAPGDVSGLRTTDVDGDGVADLMISSGLDVFLWRGGALTAAPTWTFTWPAGVTYAWPGAPESIDGARVPALLGLDRGRVLRYVHGRAPTPVADLAFDLAWSDPRRVMLTDFVRGDALLLPTPRGWRWVPDLAAPGRGIELEAPPRRATAPEGPFLEDRALATTIWASPLLVRGAGEAGSPRGRDSVWVVCDAGLRAFFAQPAGVETRTWETRFLPAEGTQRDVLADFDADGRPDLVHEATTNDSGTYAFFRTPAESGADLRPPKTTIRLTGFQMIPDYVDVDGDGRPDFIVTTIDIDGSNVIAAVTRGRVVAKTRAFLNRSAQGETWFRAIPDAEVESTIGVRILFSYAGAIDVRRSQTILTTLDLDGDRRKDLVIRTGDAQVTVRRGTPTGVWSREAYELPIPPVGNSPDVEGYGADLTGDGRDDLVLLYRGAPGQGNRTIVVPGR